MDSIWNSIGSLHIHRFGLSLGLGFLAASAVGKRTAARLGIESGRWWRMAIGLTVIALAAARLGYIVPDWRYYAERPVEILRPPIEGFSFVSGLFAALAWTWLNARKIGVAWWRLADALALPYLTALLVASIVGGSPVIWSAAAGWPSLVVHVGHVTGVYFLIWWTWTRQGQGSVPLELTTLALGGDALLRFVFGSFLAFGMPGGWSGMWPVHASRLIMAAVGAGLYASVTRGERAFPLTEPFVRPLSRWVGWLAAYGCLVALALAWGP